MIRHRGFLVLALAAILAVGLLPASNLEAQGSKGTIKIATQSPLSGGQAALGEGIKLGAQLAIEKFKGALEKQGFKVELVPFDDQAKPDVGVANAKNIIADKDILAIIGHLNSGVAIPSSEVYKEVSLAMISPANTNPVVTDRGYPNVNRVCGRDDVQGVVGSEFAHATMKAKTVYIIHDKTPYGQGVAEFFKADAEKKGLKIVGFEGTEEKSNFDPIVTPMKAKNPDVIYFGGIYDQAAPFFKQAREKGVKGKFFGPDGMDSSDLTKIAGKAVVGMYYTSAAGPASELPKAKAFVDEFKKDIEKKGVKVVGFDGTEEKSNFDPIITPIKAKNPDLIYFGGIYDQGAPFFKQAREKGIKSKFLGPDGLDSSDLVKIAGKAVVGMYYTTAAAPASSPQAKQFAEEFKKKFGKSPEPYAAESYVATAIALKALESVTSGGKAPTRPAVSKAIRQVKYTGMTGSIEFDDKGDPKKASYYVLQVASDNPEKWSENKEAKRLAIAAPTATK